MRARWSSEASRPCSGCTIASRRTFQRVSSPKENPMLVERSISSSTTGGTEA
jgi:hypothetical protein